MFKIIAIISIVVLFPVLIQAQNFSDTDLDNYSDLPLTLNYKYNNNTNLTLDGVKHLLQSKCEKFGVSDPNIIVHIAEGATQLRQCINGLLNLTEIYNEIETARPVGTLDIVFEKYCIRRSLVFDCLRAFNVELLPCLSEKEQWENYIFMRIIYNLLEFFCDHSGSPIILFISEQGPECLESNKQHIIDCVNATFQDYLPEKGEELLLKEVPELVIEPKQCLELYELEGCVLQHLEQCSEPTPANMVEAVFRYVRKETKCQREIDKSQQKLRLNALANDNGVRNNNPAQLPPTILFLCSCYILLTRFTY